MANRSIMAKHKRGVKQRQALGFIEGSKPAYSTNKPLLREIAATAQHMVKPASKRTMIEPCDPVMVPYMPHRAPKVRTAFIAAWKDFGNELVKRADYLKR